jgi:four helix bundle protein
MKKDEEPKREPDLGARLKAFALRIIRLYSSLPKTVEAQVIGRQVLKSGMSPGAHYREARRARSSAEYVSKIEGGSQELEETCYWLELLAESGIVSERRLTDLHKETEELIAIFASCAIKAKKRK